LVNPRLRFAVLERDGFRCYYCGSQGQPLEVDHVVPQSLGGQDLPDNLVAACSDCNRGKSGSGPGASALGLSLPPNRSALIAARRSEYQQAIDSVTKKYDLDPAAISAALVTLPSLDNSTKLEVSKKRPDYPRMVAGHIGRGLSHEHVMHILCTKHGLPIHIAGHLIAEAEARRHRREVNREVEARRSASARSA
jgi:hypothetical protein